VCNVYPALFVKTQHYLSRCHVTSAVSSHTKVRFLSLSLPLSLFLSLSLLLSMSTQHYLSRCHVTSVVSSHTFSFVKVSRDNCCTNNCRTNNCRINNCRTNICHIKSQVLQEIENFEILNRRKFSKSPTRNCIQRSYLYMYISVINMIYIYIHIYIYIPGTVRDDCRIESSADVLRTGRVTLCVCVCVCERERERESACVSV